MAAKKQIPGVRERWQVDMIKRGEALKLEVIFAVGPGRRFAVHRRSKRLFWGAGTAELEAYLAGYRHAKEPWGG